jgi:phenylpyruvate tautomerase PptA (4-oxalocrotonate tautomerase family)
MPISVKVSRGLLTPAGEREVLPRLTHALLEAHGLGDNAFMSAHVVGRLEVGDPSSSYVAGAPKSLAIIEVKVPSATFRDRSTQQRFIAQATDLIDSLKAGDHPRTRTYVNVTYAVDGAWGIAGQAYSNEELGAAIAAAGTR